MDRNFAICFAQFGPYHHARVTTLQRTARELGATVIPVQVATGTVTYQWEATSGTSGLKLCEDLRTLCPGAEEEASALRVFLKARKLFRSEKIDTAFLPSYWPGRFFALFAAAKSLGVATVLMSESHQGTARARWLGQRLKRLIVKNSDAALVGGNPQKRYIASLGMPEEQIFTGYDAVDNEYFARRASEIRDAQILGSKSAVFQRPRSPYGLPARYFLSLGRMVEKKNLALLLSAYSCYVRQSPSDKPKVALVFVGSGDQEESLRAHSISLGLQVIDRSDAGFDFQVPSVLSPRSDMDQNGEASTFGNGAVFFYGFRQVAENPVFYALAEAFVLPSLREEWGLVVNEAMACSLPVIVSRTAGCAEDLLPTVRTHATDSPLNIADNQVISLGQLLQARSNGFLFDPTSQEALTTALAHIANQELMTIGQDVEAYTIRSNMSRQSLQIISEFGCENFSRQAILAANAAKISMRQKQ